MDLGLTGLRAAVIGGSRGIGRAIAMELAREGCKVSICARSEPDLRATTEALAALGGDVCSRPLDVRDHSALRRWIADTAETFGGLDVLILNVSAQSFAWEESFRVDILAAMAAVDAATPHLRAARAGAIVAVGSQAALLSVPSYAPYSAMKAALVSAMSSLAVELARASVRVNTVSPSAVFFEGGFWDRMRVEDPALYTRTLERLPAGRFCTPEEVARAVVFLASPAASYVSGSHLLVDHASREHVQF